MFQMNHSSEYWLEEDPWEDSVVHTISTEDSSSISSNYSPSRSDNISRNGFTAKQNVESEDEANYVESKATPLIIDLISDSEFESGNCLFDRDTLPFILSYLCCENCSRRWTVLCNDNHCIEASCCEAKKSN